MICVISSLDGVITQATVQSTKQTFQIPLPLIALLLGDLSFHNLLRTMTLILRKYHFFFRKQLGEFRTQVILHNCHDSVGTYLTGPKPNSIILPTCTHHNLEVRLMLRRHLSLLILKDLHEFLSHHIEFSKTITF
ncbi:hypothetical protein VTL71DRAFT_6569 [Oculimacula yallundae]|uniref:Uncharacterized protein n=1 Tax=Oculimacula yallundae TaxID=86028 RepID=A0ABR4BZY6_9HELO